MIAGFVWAILRGLLEGMAEQGKATIVVPSEDPKKKPSEEKTPGASIDQPKGKDEAEDELVSTRLR